MNNYQIKQILEGDKKLTVGDLTKMSNLKGKTILDNPNAGDIKRGEIVAYNISDKTDIAAYELDKYGVRTEDNEIFFPSVDDDGGITELHKTLPFVLKAERVENKKIPINFWSPGQINDGVYELDPSTNKVVQLPKSNIGMLVDASKPFDFSNIGISNERVDKIDKGEASRAWIDGDVITAIHDWGTQSGKVTDVLFVIYGYGSCALITRDTPSADENVFIDKDGKIIKSANTAIKEGSIA